MLYATFVETLPRFTESDVIAITGTTSGTGYVAAKTAAERGAHVLLLNRKSNRSRESLVRLRAEVGRDAFTAVDCDLSSFDSVRTAAAAIKRQHKEIRVLALNAGIMATPDEATVDGYDTQMQVNHLSQFLLAAELYPLVEAYAQEHGDARIVTHSSLGRLYTPNPGLESKYLEANGGHLGGNSNAAMRGAAYQRYFQSKLANSVFMYALHERLAARGSKVKAVSAHPGGSSTSLGDHLSYNALMSVAMWFVERFLIQSAEDGAVGLMLGMMSADAESGVLYGPKNNVYGMAVPNPPKPYETDPAAKEMLWRLSEKATGATFKI